MNDDVKENRNKSQKKIDKGEYDVFLSYNHKDEQSVTDIAKQLQDNGIAPFLDKWDLQPGLSWLRTVMQQIPKSKSAAIFIGEAGIGPWQQEEMEAFMEEYVLRKCPVIPVLLYNAPEKLELPPFLRNKTWVDFRKTDPRPLFNLLWGITGKKPERVYRPGVLIASLGDSPVVVSAMYDLLTKGAEDLTIDHVTILRPSGDDVRLAYKLVEESLNKLCELHCEPLDFDDANNERDAYIFLQQLCRLLDHYQRQDETVYLSLAGGRKSMAALMAWVVPFFPCVKKLYHIIDKEKDRFPSVYEINALSIAKRSQMMHPPDLRHLALIDIPFKRELQMSATLRSELLFSRPEDYKDTEEAEALINAQAILQFDAIPKVEITDLVIEQFSELHAHQKENARIVHNGLKEMSNIATLRDHQADADTYSYKPRRFQPISLHYFTGLQIPIRPIFYTLPEDIYDNPAEPVEQVIICALEQADANGYRALEEIKNSPSFSHKHCANFDALPTMPTPANSILIVPLGKSPMIATQLYTLLTEQEQHTIYEMILIYPKEATEIVNAAQIIKKAMREEHNAPCTLVGIPGLDDIASTEACRKYQAHLEAEIARIQHAYPDYKIDLALSGGRKGMTAMTIFAAQKMHIPYVYHTLINDQELNDKIDETTVTSLNDTRLSTQERNDRLFLHAYKVEGPKPYAKFVLFRVPVFSTAR